MEALVYVGPHELELRQEEAPTPAEGEALIRIHACGICGSDMHGYHGADPRRKPPLILGHEAAGEVVSGSNAGQRVVLNPLVSCGTCPACTGGRANLCPDRSLIGMARPGAFAEYVTLPERNLIPMPDGMPMTHAALTEPTATALHGVHLAQRAAFRPFAEGEVLVIGGGAIGILSALILRWQGCSAITVAETNPVRREMVAASGVGRVIDPTDEAPDPDRYPLVVDAVGFGATRDTAVSAVAPGGVVLHVGLGQSRSELDARKLTLSEVYFVGCYTYTPTDMRAALHALHRGDLGDLGWMQERPLAEGATAFRELDEGALAEAKVVLLPPW